MIPKPTSARYMPSLAERAVLRLSSLRTTKAEKTLQVVKPYTPHPPSPKQRAFLELDATEALYGGAAGGGKSDALIMGALQYIDRPRYAALLMRRRKIDLEKDGAILDRARHWFAGTAARWDAKLFGFRFPSPDSNPGATISFGHLEHLSDREQWKGPAFQYIGIDELTEWDAGSYLFMFSRLRSLAGGVPTRMRSATNPGGEGHDFVFERFVRYAKQLGTGVLYDVWRKGEKAGAPFFESPASAEVLQVSKEEGVAAQGAFFVPAFARDNPALNVAEYRVNLARLDAVERAWYDEGDWTAVPSGKYFRREWFKFIDAPPPGVFWIRYWDLAGTLPTEAERKKDQEKNGPAFTAGVKLGVRILQTGAYELIVADVVRDKMDPPEVQGFVKATAELDTRRVQVVIEQDPGQAGKDQAMNYQRTVLPGWAVHANRATGPKESWWTSLAAFAKAGGVFLVRGEWNEAFVKELVSLPAAKKDQADAASRGYAWLTGDEGKRLSRVWLLANS